MTAHEINNTIARAWVQHQRRKFNTSEQELNKTKVLNIKNRIIAEMNDACYAQHKEIIDLSKNKAVVLKLKYTYKNSICANEYPLSIRSFLPYAWQHILEKDEEYIEVTKQIETNKDKHTTDRGLFYVQCMLLYKPEMKQAEFYETIKIYYTT